MDPNLWEIDWTGESGEMWLQDPAKYKTKLYPDTKDQLPHDFPEPLGHEVNMSCFVDTDHADKNIKWRSHAWIILFINSAPI